MISVDMGSSYNSIKCVPTKSHKSGTKQLDTWRPTLVTVSEALTLARATLGLSDCDCSNYARPLPQAVLTKPSLTVGLLTLCW